MRTLSLSREAVDAARNLADALDHHGVAEHEEQLLDQHALSGLWTVSLQVPALAGGWGLSR